MELDTVWVQGGDLGGQGGSSPSKS